MNSFPFGVHTSSLTLREYMLTTYPHLKKNSLKVVVLFAFNNHSPNSIFSNTTLFDEIHTKHRPCEHTECK